MTLVKYLIEGTIEPEDLHILKLIDTYKERLDFELLTDYLNAFSKLRSIRNEYAIKQIMLLYIAHPNQHALYTTICDYTDEMSAQLVPRYNRNKLKVTTGHRPGLKIEKEPRGCTGSRTKTKKPYDNPVIVCSSTTSESSKKDPDFDSKTL